MATSKLDKQPIKVILTSRPFKINSNICFDSMFTLVHLKLIVINLYTPVCLKEKFPQKKEKEEEKFPKVFFFKKEKEKEKNIRS